MQTLMFLRRDYRDILGGIVYRISVLMMPHMVAKAVKNLKGQVIVSFDDHPEVRKAFKGCRMESLKFRYSFARDKDLRTKGHKKELLIDCSRRR